MVFRRTLLALAPALVAASAFAQDRLPVVTTVGTTSALEEEKAADETGRPEWTSARRFGRTRIYLQAAPGEINFEQWARIRDFRDDA
jgi:hypothetical protein